MPRKMYDDLAAWWPLLSAPADYAEEAAFYRNAIHAAGIAANSTLLELGSGGGNNASHLKQHFRCTLVEPSAGMRAVSQALNPECEHIEGDMRTVRLDRTFDAVFIHDAICYMTTHEDLRRALETAFVHVRPGGVAIFAPDYVRENFEPSTDHGGHDGPSRSMRYLEWTWDPDPADTSYTVDYALLLRDENGMTRAVHDRHIEGLFPRDTWLDLLRDVGFEPDVLGFDHTDVPQTTLVVFRGRRP